MQSKLWLAGLALGFLFFFGAPASSGPFFNSAELGCDGSDPNVLFCDDFETNQSGGTPGNWYSLNCDSANAVGGIATQSKGWCGTIFADPIAPAGAVDCTSGITPFGKCAATSGVLSGATGGRNMADHDLNGRVEVTEIYIRWYYKPSLGMQFSGQKVLDLNRCCAGGGGIFWLGIGYNVGQGSRSTTPALMAAIGTGNPVGSKICDPTTSGNKELCQQNQGVDQFAVLGHWNYYEFHIKLNTPGATDGILEAWVNDCGAAGTSCSGTPTLRMRHVQVDYGKTAANGGIGTLWFENWANNGDGVGSLGQEWYDNIKVSKVGPIGFVGGNRSSSPGSPSALNLQ